MNGKNEETSHCLKGTVSSLGDCLRGLIYEFLGLNSKPGNHNLETLLDTLFVLKPGERAFNTFQRNK